MLDAKIQRVSDLCGGKADIDFREMLGKVIDNINDVKYPAGDVRKITMAIAFYPDPANKTIEVAIQTGCSLPKKVARKAITFIGNDTNGQVGLFTEDPDQIKMFNDLAPRGAERQGE